tara:strand:- start:42 stop:491 length:450 start_codon:yes stop_codon:yes gene_type:complete
MIKKLFISFLLLILTSCGYQPLYSKKEIKLIVKDLEQIGNVNLNNKIISALSIEIDKSNFSNQKIILRSSKQIIETSKNNKGQPDTYKMLIDLKFSRIDNNGIFSEENFSEEFSYKNKDNKFNLSQYEIEIEKNLINKIIEKLILYINI